MKKVPESHSHSALNKHINELSKIKATYEIDIASALEAIQQMKVLNANAQTLL